MVAEPWILKMGNQVSSNLKHALYHENSTKSSNKKQGPQNRQTIGILSFEVANVMSKIIHLHKSLTDNEILKLKNEILKSEGIKTLVSNDEKQLLELALEEKLDDLNKDMEGMVRKMERYVNSTANLYTEMEVMNELEVATKKFQQNHHEESRKAFEQKLTWQKQDVKHLKDVSLWNQTYDKAVELLARTVCTIYARIYTVFVDSHSRGDIYNALVPRSQVGFSGSLRRVKRDSGQLDVAGKDKRILWCKERAFGFSGFFVHAINGDPPNGGQRQSKGNLVNCSKFGQCRLLGCALPSTVGGSALALHYANIIIVLEKLLKYPHLVGEEARDDLYQMLPTSLRKTLKISLKSYIKDLAIYDAPLAHNWRERLDLLLKWLAPLAHNTIRWQSERNFEQQQIVTRANVLLLQTLYFADREKTEAAICEVLVGLNYICRYEQQQNALLDCASSFDFEDCMEWQLQVRASFNS
ncbi:hypothetical protein DH2020_027513 [Rehmannia glutinosa]|uniref:DUF668 domain-containing protein n=1 Tax=Rehmannia glutinosa TaxID=99300 RepID=A0ABR0VVS4_REHGL